MMQLDLFADNRANILLNIVDEYLLAQNFDKALSTCSLVRDEYPENRQAKKLCGAIETWQGLLAGVEAASCQPGQLNELHIRLGSERLNEEMFECYMQKIRGTRP
jgi:hypothetical protein